MSRAPAAASAGTAVVDQALGARVDAFMSDAPRLASELWTEVSRRAAAAGPAMARLIEAARAADGGKHVRPRLVAAAFYGLQGSDASLLRRVAGAQQLLHIGLCMHDDVIDGDRVRHGRPNVIGLVEREARAAGLGAAAAARQGEASGILAGDLALNAAVLALLDAPAPASMRLRLAGAALEAVERTIAGEFLDLRSEMLAPARSEPLQVALLKTASYSVTLPLTLGALAAGADDPALLGALERVGSAFGAAYQLSDDDLGLFGSPAVTGKSALSDLRDGKRTEHIRIAHARAGGAERSVIDDVLGRPSATEADAERVRGIVTATGARAAVHDVIDRHLDRGIRAAADGLPPMLAAHLTDLARALGRRER
ncbi:polyprenyl synthetase family protein [Agromyces sp. NPDC058484]|uniref:polyprenyl synthetase family protein n=1 Tax=Agromyces sp. NPDC058484 TaxID=3346524 RepID=UPI00365A0134